MGQTLESGVEFAGYRIEALLGRGGMSEVYRASNPRLGNTVALKLLARELAEDRLFQERFMRESRLAASLNHPNVVPVFDADESAGLAYIAMRFVDGPDLKQLIARDGPLPLDYATSILGQVAAALDTAHANGLIHRDVKPGNILIDEKAAIDGVPHVYLSDFGVAKHNQSHSGLTSTGHFVGTIDYIAPEQIEGKPLDGTTDLYSLGCLLYESLTGVPPFDRESDVAMIYAHLVDAPPAVSAQRPDLPAALDGVIGKALSKRPEDRYKTCREFVSAVRMTYGAETAGRPTAAAAGATTAAAPVASETVLSPASTPETPATILSNEPAAPAPAPPTAPAIPPTEVAGAIQASAASPPGMPPPPGDAGARPPGPEEQTTMRRLLGPRYRVWTRGLAVAVAALLVAGGATAAVLVTSSGSDGTSNSGSTQSRHRSGTDIGGTAVNPTVSSSRRGTNRTGTSQTTTSRHRTTTTKTTTTTRRRTTAGGGTTTSRRRTTTSSGSGTTTSRHRTTTSSGGTTTSRRRTSASSGGSSSGGTTTSRRR